MCRFQRVVVPGLPHHITQCGNRRCNAFSDDQDRLVFLCILGEVSHLYLLCRFAYCPDEESFHLIKSSKNQVN